jgi:hypothetical protein
VNEKISSNIIIMYACILVFTIGFFTGRALVFFGTGSAGTVDGNRNGTDGQYQFHLENERIIGTIRNELENCNTELRIIRGNSEGTIEKVERLRAIIQELAAYRDFFDRVQHLVDGGGGGGNGNDSGNELNKTGELHK